MIFSFNANTGVVTLANGSVSGNDIGYRNLTGNGALDFWQRGTTFSNITTTGQYTADRYVLIYAGTSYSNTIAQVTDVPTIAQVGTPLQYSLKLTVVTAKPVLSATDAVSIRTHIIGYDYSLVHLKSFTLSFWVKSSITGTFSASFQNAAGNASINKSYTVNAINTWERKIVTIDTSITPNPGSYDLTSGAGIKVSFCLAAGTSQIQADNTWFSGASDAATGQTNFISAISRTFQIAGIQVEAGSSASSLEHRPGKIELDNARYYYQKWSASNHNVVGSGYLSTTTAAPVLGVLSAPMRVTPTITFGGTAANFKVANLTSTGDSSNAAPTSSGASPESATFTFTTGSAWTGSAGQGCIGLLTTDATIAFDAEF